MKQLALAVLFLFSIGSGAAASEFPEPPFKWAKRFQLNEIPGKASVYYDIDGDGTAEILVSTADGRLHCLGHTAR